MINNIFQQNKKYFMVLLLTMSILILGNLLNKNIFLIIGMLCWIAIYMMDKENHSKEFIIVRMLILSIPLSFTNIFGGHYGVSPLSWFNVFFMILLVLYIAKYFVKRKVYFDYLSLAAIFMIFISIAPLLKSFNFKDGLKQYINILVPFLMIILGSSIKYSINDSEKEILITDYIRATEIAAIGVLVQIFFVQVLGYKTIGNYLFLGGYRHSYGFLFSDFSFLSLYLSSGAIMVYFIKRKNNKLDTKIVSEMIFLVITSVLTSARTGIVAFAAVFCSYIFFEFIKLVLKGSRKAVFFAIVNFAVIITSYLLIVKARGKNSLNDSGRLKLNKMAFDTFLKNPILGLGFGSSNYTNLVGTLPHNIFYQALAQGGLIYTIPLIIFLFLVLWTAYKNDIGMLPVISCILIGSLFIPNILNSRFLPVIFLMLVLRTNEKGINFNFKFLKRVCKC